MFSNVFPMFLLMADFLPEKRNCNSELLTGFSAQMGHPNLIVVVPNPNTVRWYHLFSSCALHHTSSARELHGSCCFYPPSVLSPSMLWVHQSISGLFPMSNSEFKTCYMTCNGPLKNTQRAKDLPPTTTDKSILSSCNGVLLLLSLWDMSQGVGSFPIICSASIFALGEHCNSELFTEKGEHPARVDIQHVE